MADWTHCGPNGQVLDHLTEVINNFSISAQGLNIAVHCAVLVTLNFSGPHQKRPTAFLEVFTTFL